MHEAARATTFGGADPKPPLSRSPNPLSASRTARRGGSPSTKLNPFLDLSGERREHIEHVVLHVLIGEAQHFHHRQNPFGTKVVDFYCHEARLAIEIDGDHHDALRDEVRDTELSANLVASVLFAQPLPKKSFFLSGVTSKLRRAAGHERDVVAFHT